MMLLILLVGLIANTVNSSAGCSDYGCECHPDDKCDPKYAKDNSCHKTKKGCYGPVIGTMFTITLNSSIVETLIPNGLELGKVPNWPDSNTRPVQFFFNQQQNVGDYNYLEFILMVTYIQWNDQNAPKYKYRGPFGYGTKLYLDKVGPTVGGQAFGINKEVADISQSCDMNGNCVYNISSKEGKEILSAQWNVAKNVNYMNASDSINFVEYQKAAFSLPTLGQYPVNEGVFQCIDTDWFIDNAMIQPLIGTFSIKEKFYGNIPTGTFDLDKTITEDGIFGGYRLETMWMFEEQASPNKETCTNYEPPNQR